MTVSPRTSITEFTFAFTPNTHIMSKNGEYILYSKAPVHAVRINQALYNLLKPNIADSCPRVRYCAYPGNDKYLHTLLLLASKGYLTLEDTGEPEIYPSVSVIIPVRNQSEHLVQCLHSLSALEYPSDRLEIIVVDDGSDKDCTPLIEQYNAVCIRLEHSKGAANARNVGVSHATGNILAFMDADCVADANWLKRLVPFFTADTIGIVGGFVDSYYRESRLDRYEQVCSSLTMGNHLVYESGKASGFYVPTCNMLVTRKAFSRVAGFRYGMHVGEDVDFCWRIRKQGYSLLYVPDGVVYHKHRNQLWKMMSRRSDYGTSESLLYSLYHRKKKFIIPVFSTVLALVIVVALLLHNIFILGALVPVLGLDIYRRYRAITRLGITLSSGSLCKSTLRDCFSLLYFGCFHFIRYYFLLMAILSCFIPWLWVAVLIAMLVSSLTDYYIRKPALSYLIFLFYYLMEHLSYQTGVFKGCVKKMDFRAYITLLKFT